ncbi:hypothetical protein, conserved [Eimeria tenella]|uniref:Defective in cullin neddylation protein n=1 Tax=Eimeria tenella TaxID=5802 RepID=U6L0M1_EIMTE|nr:hypothetical protein, conserved [Eimeria tenella]CDJ41315.1 hypothetical protein, conserved [Eimeria tenella]|eukprot:XP_013232065.1 hypothetical protein, conserved [Eimeria tenella]
MALFFDKYAVCEPGAAGAAAATGAAAAAAAAAAGKAIQGEGLERLSGDLGVGLDDIFFLVFAFHCGCRTQGVITREDFLRGLRSLGVDTLQGLQGLVQQQQQAPYRDRQLLRRVYSFAFVYSLEPQQKQLPTDLAVAYWQLLLQPLQWCLLQHFLRYVECTSTLRSINKDVWLMVLEFALSSLTSGPLVPCSSSSSSSSSSSGSGQEAGEPSGPVDHCGEAPDQTIDRILEEYEDDGAWPLLIDNFVEWMREQRSSK